MADMTEKIKTMNSVVRTGMMLFRAGCVERRRVHDL